MADTVDVVLYNTRPNACLAAYYKTFPKMNGNLLQMQFKMELPLANSRQLGKNTKKK